MQRKSNSIYVHLDGTVYRYDGNYVNTQFNSIIDDLQMEKKANFHNLFAMRKTNYTHSRHIVPLC